MTVIAIFFVVTLTVIGMWHVNEPVDGMSINRR